jgi:hypothetical protein
MIVNLSVIPPAAARNTALVAIPAVLALAPTSCQTRPLDVAAKVCVFVLLVASYDPLLGYPASSRSRTPCSSASVATASDPLSRMEVA